MGGRLKIEYKVSLGYAGLVQTARSTWMGGYCGATLHPVGPVAMTVDQSEIAEFVRNHLRLVELLFLRKPAKRKHCAEAKWTACAAALKKLVQKWLKQSWLINDVPVSAEMLPVSAAVFETVERHPVVD